MWHRGAKIRFEGETLLPAFSTLTTALVWDTVFPVIHRQSVVGKVDV